MPSHLLSAYSWSAFPFNMNLLRALALFNLPSQMDTNSEVFYRTTELISRIGAKKARMRIDKMFINSFMGGGLISFGCALALSTNSSPWFQTNAPGLIRTISAMVFPVGLIMVVLTGADLFTSYCMYSVVALLHRRCSALDLLKTWVVSFFGNLAGALFFMAVLTGCSY